MGIPNLTDQLRYIVDWRKPDYTANWKEMEEEFGGCPVQSIIGDKELYKKNKNQIDPIALSTLKQWFKIIIIRKIQDSNIGQLGELLHGVLQ